MFVLLLVFVLAVCLSSCKQDIDYVLGKWIYEGYDEILDSDFQLILEFKRDKTITIAKYKYGELVVSDFGTFSITSRTTGSIILSEEMAKYTLSGDNLMIGEMVFEKM